MKIDFNKQKILNNIGIEFTDSKDYILYIQNLLEYLESNNKNYTKRQYFKILELKEIFDNLEVVNND